MTGPELKLIPGGKQRPYAFGAVTVVASPRHDPPFEPEVRVQEEDTWRLLSAPAHVVPQPEHPIRLMTALIDDRAVPPGRVLVTPRGWLAVVYDLDRDPVCREEWVAEALRNLLRTAGRRRVRSLALPLLGWGQRVLPWQRVLEVLVRTLEEPAARPAQPLRIWLQLPAELHGTAAVALSELAADTRRG